MLLAALLAAAAVRAADPYSGGRAEVYGWERMAFAGWENDTAKGAYEAGGYRNVLVAGVKVAADGRVFVTMPRWNPGVPATLALVEDEPLDGPSDLYSGRSSRSPAVRPWPSWEMNREGDPDALQSVLGLEIDSESGLLWALDQGRVNNRPALPGSVKLLAFELGTGRVAHRHVFPESQASLSASFLNDLVVDRRRGLLYVTDSGVLLPSASPDAPLRGGLLVVDPARGASWRVLDSMPSTQDDPGCYVTVEGRKVNPTERMRTGADGIALTADGQTLYYCPLTSRQLYSVSTAELASGAEPAVRHVGDKVSASDGLACSNTAACYATWIERHGVARWAHDGHTLNRSLGVAVQSASDMVWPDTLAFDHRGSVLFVANQLNNFVIGGVSFAPGRKNFFVHAFYEGAGVGAYLDGVPSGGGGGGGMSPAIVALAVTACAAAAAAGAALYLWQRNRKEEAAAAAADSTGTPYTPLHG